LNVAILVGGRGRRINAEKGLLEIKGKKFIEILVEKFKDCNVIIVCRDEKQAKLYERFGETIIDEVKDFGPLAAIYSALKYFKDYVLVVAVDMPLIKKELAKHIFEVCKNGYDAVIPKWKDGKVEPLLACYSFKAIGEIEKSIMRGERKIIKSMERLNVLYYPIEELRRFDENLLSFINVNTKKELELVRCLSTDLEEL